LTISPHVAPPALRGAQDPRIFSVPPSVSTSGAEAVELAQIAGLKLDPWQQTVLIQSLGEAPAWKCSRCTFRSDDGTRCAEHPLADLVHPWAAPEVGLVVPRQNGKSELLVARMLAGVFLLGEELVLYSAHQFDTAMEIFNRLCAVIDQTPALVAKVRLNRGKVGTYSHGQEGITLKTGQRIRFKARTSGGGRGFSCDCLILDEAMILPETFLGATIPTLSARANPQVWFAGSAVDQQVHEAGVVLAKRRERGLAGDDPTLAYFEWSAEGDSPDTVDDDVLDDLESWRQANPAFGIRISPEYIFSERAALGRRNFAVERLGIGDWPDTSEESGRLISQQQWSDAAEHDQANTIDTKTMFAIDASPDHAWGSVAVAGARADKVRQFAIVAHERGLDWVVDLCTELKARNRSAKFAVDVKGPVAHLIGPLKDAGVKVIEITAEDYATACAEFKADVTAEPPRAKYPAPQPELESAIIAAREQKMGDRSKWARRTSTSPDISPLVAATLALWAHRHAAKPPRVINLNDYATTGR
jgi:hypothetical protein